MKTVKISIMGEYPKIEWKSMPGTYVKIHPHFVTFVHRDHRYYEPEGSPALHNNRPKYYSTWNVSEVTTGAKITTGNTRTQAIANAKAKIEQVGEEGMTIAIKNYQERIKSYEQV
jgi:hypothetical protein